MKQHVIPSDWVKKPVAIVASGSSVLSFDFSKIEHMPVVAVKDGYLAYPTADVLIVGDPKYAKRNTDFEAYLGPTILYTDPDHVCPWDDSRIEFIPKVKGDGLSSSKLALRGSFSTVCLAINYAYLRGSRDLYLIGVDGKPGPEGQRSFAREEKDAWPQRYNRQTWGYQRQARHFNRLRLRVTNLNPDSSIKVFPTGSLPS